MPTHRHGRAWRGVAVAWRWRWRAMSNPAGRDPTVPHPTELNQGLHTLTITLRLTQITAPFCPPSPPPPFI